MVFESSFSKSSVNDLKTLCYVAPTKRLRKPMKVTVHRKINKPYIKSTCEGSKILKFILVSSNGSMVCRLRNFALKYFSVSLFSPSIPIAITRVKDCLDHGSPQARVAVQTQASQLLLPLIHLPSWTPLAGCGLFLLADLLPSYLALDLGLLLLFSYISPSGLHPSYDQRLLSVYFSVSTLVTNECALCAE